MNEDNENKSGKNNGEDDSEGDGDADDDDDDENDSLDSEEILENDIMWLETGDHKPSIVLDEINERDSFEIRPGSESESENNVSPKKLSYRERISDNIKRRMQYRESILLQFSGLQEDDTEKQQSPTKNSKKSTTTTNKPKVVFEDVTTKNISSQPQEIKSNISSTNSIKSSEEIKTNNPTKSPLNNSKLSISTHLKNFIKSIGTLFRHPENIMQWVDIVPVLILTLVIYFVSVNQFEKKDSHAENENTEHSNL